MVPMLWFSIQKLSLNWLFLNDLVSYIKENEKNGKRKWKNGIRKSEKYVQFLIVA